MCHWSTIDVQSIVIDKVHEMEIICTAINLKVLHFDLVILISLIHGFS